MDKSSAVQGWIRLRVATIQAMIGVERDSSNINKDQ